jgi:hypothetical protein
MLKQGKKKSRNLKFIFYIIFMIILLMPLNILLIDFNSKGTVSAISVVTHTTDTDFENGTFEHTRIEDININASLQLALLGEWTNKNPPNQPPTRYDFAMATIWGTDKVLLYGGEYNNQMKKDCWIYDLSENNWTNMKPKNRPGYRTQHEMAFIYGTDKVLLYGSRNWEIDTWIYDLSENNWTKMKPSKNPGSRIELGMASIYNDDKVVLYGGHVSFSFYTDTWVYDLSDDEWTSKKPNSKPGPRRLHELESVYNEDKVILYGGRITPQVYNQTWIYDLSENNWTQKKQKPNPANRCDYSMAFIYGTDNILLFSGLCTSNIDDTWLYDVGENTWTGIKITGKSKIPSPRTGHRLATIYGTDIVLLLGPTHSDDTWTYKRFLPFNNGTYTSEPHYFGSNSTLNYISWNVSNTINTSIKIQLRTGQNVTDIKLKNFIGPDGNISSNYTVSPSKIWSGHKKYDRFIQYRIHFNTLNKNQTPIFNDITFSYNQKPNTSLVSPNNNIIITNNKPTFSWNFSDVDSTRQTAFQLIIDNDKEFNSVNYNSGKQNSLTSQWSFPSGTSYTNILDGRWYWMVRTKDSDGGWGSYSSPFTLTIDASEPSSMITHPSHELYSNNIMNISGISTDHINGSGIDFVEVSIRSSTNNRHWDGSSWIPLKIWLPTTGTDYWLFDTSSVTWTSRDQYNIQSRAIDIATNVEHPNSGINFTFECDRPISTIETPSNNSFVNKLNNISGNAIDYGNAGVIRNEISIIRTSDNRYWDNNDWKLQEQWIITNGTEQWIYNSSTVKWATNYSYVIRSRAIDSAGNIELPGFGNKFIYDDKPPTNLEIIINNGAEFTNSTLVSLSIEVKDYLSGIDSIALSLDNKSWSTWEDYNTFTTIQLLKGDGNKTVYFIARDHAGNIATPVSDSIILDSIPPSNLTIMINQGEKYTNSTDVILSLNANDSASGVSQMMFSTDVVTWSSEEEYDNYRSFKLPIGDGEKQVHFKVIDNVGNVAESVSDIIILDTTPPEQLTVVIKDNAEYTNHIRVPIDLAAIDTGSGVKDYSLSKNNEYWTSWKPFITSTSMELLFGDGEKTVYLKVCDKAGNIAQTEDTIILDTEPPYSLSISINNGLVETKSKSVLLKLTALDNASGVYQMAFSSDGIIWTSWEDYKELKKFELTPGNGIKTVYFKVKDNLGNTANPISTEIKLNIKSSVVDDTPGDGETPKDGETSSDKSSDNNIFEFLLILVITVIIILIIIGLIIKRKKQSKQQSHYESETISTKPETVDTHKPTPDEDPESQLIQQTPEQILKERSQKFTQIIVDKEFQPRSEPSTIPILQKESEPTRIQNQPQTPQLASNQPTLAATIEPSTQPTVIPTPQSTETTKLVTQLSEEQNT